MENKLHAHRVKFNNAVWELLRMMQRLARTTEMMALAAKTENMYKIAIKVDADAAISKSVAYFFEYNEAIERRDESFFMAECMKTTTEVNDRKEKTDDDELLLKLLDAVKTMYANANATNKDKAYHLVKELRDAAMAFGIDLQTTPS